MRIYLAGPITHNDRYNKWREAIKENWEGPHWVDPAERISREEAQAMPAKELVRHDKELLATCDALLVGLTRHRSIGTWREVEYAVETLDIPVAIWIEPGGSAEPIENRDFSPWMEEAGVISQSFTTCLAWLQAEDE